LAIVVAAWQESSLNAQIIYSLNPKVKWSAPTISANPNKRVWKKILMADPVYRLRLEKEGARGGGFHCKNGLWAAFAEEL
jgi:hypothetical protein